MKQGFNNMFSALNQAAKTGRTLLKFREFKEAPLILRRLVDAGYVQWFCKKGSFVQVRLRQTHRGTVLSCVRQLSKPSKRNTVGWKDAPKAHTNTLCLSEKEVVQSNKLSGLKRGGVLLASFK